MTYYTLFRGTFCEIALVGDEYGLSYLELITGKRERKLAINESWQRNDLFFEKEKQQVLEYLEGKRRTFEVKLNPKGTEFQKKIWRTLEKIPYGELKSYKDIAIAIGNENSCRAVGLANSKNPIPLIIPCHRVIGSDGSLTGFAYGIELKKKLIEMEQNNK